MELEEKIFFGTLGSLKIRDRAAWQEALKDGKYDRQCEALSWGGEGKQWSENTPLESAEASRPGTPNEDEMMEVDDDDEKDGNKRDSSGSIKMKSLTNRKVKELACAILQVEQMLDQKFLKAPLSEDEKKKAKRLKEEEKRKKVNSIND